MTSPAVEIIDRLRAKGVELVASGSDIWFRPKDRVTPDERAALKQCKSDILASLEHEAILRAAIIGRLRRDQLWLTADVGPDADWEVVRVKWIAAEGVLRGALLYHDCIDRSGRCPVGAAIRCVACDESDTRRAI